MRMVPGLISVLVAVDVWDDVGVGEGVVVKVLLGDGVCDGVGVKVWVLVCVGARVIVEVGVELCEGNQIELAYFGVPGMGAPRLS